MATSEEFQADIENLLFSHDAFDRAYGRLLSSPAHEHLLTWLKAERERIDNGPGDVAYAVIKLLAAYLAVILGDATPGLNRRTCEGLGTFLASHLYSLREIK